MPFPARPALACSALLLTLAAGCSGSDENRVDGDGGSAPTGGTASGGADGSGGGGNGGATTTSSGGAGTGGAGVGGSGVGGSGVGGSGVGGSGVGGSGVGGSGVGGSGVGGSGVGGSGAGGSGGNGGNGGSGGSGGVTNTPCQTGPGWTLWRVSWGSNSAGYATVDAWDNGCTYSLANQACSLSGEPHDDANWGPGVVFNSSTDYFRVRYSVQGLSFTNATLYLNAHADGGGIPHGMIWSPIYGTYDFVPTVPISQHKTYAIDWTPFLSPTDDPNLTAVTVESMPIGLAVSFMELCVQ